MGDALQEERKGKSLTFAEQELQRRGWKRGKGLGKREDGISEALKVKVKHDTAGDGVKVKKVSKQNRAITNKKPLKAPEDKNMLYGRFVKAATLTSGREEPLQPLSSSDSSKEDEEQDLSTARRLTDEELVRVCGGRTAHKGARHGLRMSAKLARLEAQEKAFLASCGQQKGEEAVAALSSSNVEKRQEKSKKRRKSTERKPEAVALEGLGNPCSDQEQERPKKKKKKRKRCDEGGGE